MQVLLRWFSGTASRHLRAVISEVFLKLAQKTHCNQMDTKLTKGFVNKEKKRHAESNLMYMKEKKQSTGCERVLYQRLTVTSCRKQCLGHIRKPSLSLIQVYNHNQHLDTVGN
jgi:hypothetical protein